MNYAEEIDHLNQLIFSLNALKNEISITYNKELKYNREKHTSSESMIDKAEINLKWQRSIVNKVRDKTMKKVNETLAKLNTINNTNIYKTIINDHTRN
jgi:hypothetical protein